MGAERRFMEHRWGTRIDLDAPAEISTMDGFAASGSVRNASVSGAFVETRARFPLLARIAVHPLAHRDEWLDACVVRVESRGVAIEWLDPGLRTVSGLLSLRRGAPQGGTGHLSGAAQALAMSAS
jgi:hypothetical protein